MLSHEHTEQDQVYWWKLEQILDTSLCQPPPTGKHRPPVNLFRENPSLMRTLMYKRNPKESVRPLLLGLWSFAFVCCGCLAWCLTMNSIKGSQTWKQSLPQQNKYKKPLDVVLSVHQSLTALYLFWILASHPSIKNIREVAVVFMSWQG